MRLDSHQHFWRYSTTEQLWMTEEMGALKRDFLPVDLALCLDTVGFHGCVSVQARQSLEETQWLLRLAKEKNFIKGVVGWVDLCSTELSAQLEMLSKHPKLAGVRHVVHDEEDDQFMLRADFRTGIGRLREHGLTYDLLLFPKHLPVAVKLVSEFPEQPFVLDHIAKPTIASGRISPWREDLRELARFPTVFCKLSGMVTEAKWKGWRAGDFSRYLETVFEAFGPERVMIGSDWPVCTLAADYATTMRIVIDYVQQFPAVERDGVLGANCARFYRLAS